MAGLALGLLTLLGQAVLPGNWNTLVNSGAIWLLPTFFLGATIAGAGWAALAGLGLLLCAVLGYFLSAQVFFGISFSFAGAAFWGIVALIGGPVFGLAGNWWRSVRLYRQVVAVALLGGEFITEGIYYLLVIPEHKAASGWVMMAAGLLLIILLARSKRVRWYALFALPLAILLGAGAYWLINLHIF